MTTTNHETIVTAQRLSWSQRAAVVAITGYQALRHGRLSPCRYYPTCSAYAIEAIERHGLWRGGRLAVRRLSRCHPLGGHGVDLVPLELADRRHRS